MVKPIVFETKKDVKEAPGAIVFNTPVVSKTEIIVQKEPDAVFANTKKDSVYTAKVCKKIEELNATLYQSNKLYCQSQCNLLFPLDIEFICQWGNKNLDRFSATHLEITRVIRIVTDTKCNDYIEDVSDKLKEKPNWLSGMFSSKTEWIIKIEAHLTAIFGILSDISPDLGRLMVDLQGHMERLTLKLAIIEAVTQVVGNINDNSIDMAIFSRKKLLQQAIMQSKISEQEILNTLKFIHTQKAQIDQVIKISIPLFKNIWLKAEK